MTRRRRRRLLVPFEIAPFLKAPYGQPWPEKVRQAREAAASRPPPTRLESWLGGLMLVTAYAAVIGGVWFGVAHWHGWLGALWGLGVALGIASLMGTVVLVVRGVAAGLHLVRTDRDSRHEHDSSGRTDI